jgi:hypothetical protein
MNNSYQHSIQMLRSILIKDLEQIAPSAKTREVSNSYQDSIRNVILNWRKRLAVDETMSELATNELFIPRVY